MEIGLRAGKSEADWARTLDRFARSATPLWFDWVGWALILGALLYLYQRFKSAAVLVVVCISFALFSKSDRVAHIGSIIASGAIGLGLFYLLRALLIAVAANSP